ncbi:MAG TPA: hypothetical protein VFR93_09990 [Candidatus Limnocylindrales bacterium]|nr:hypothetical protein [Candidatus Limnocylindrales bacterium]
MKTETTSTRIDERTPDQRPAAPEQRPAAPEQATTRATEPNGNLAARLDEVTQAAPGVAPIVEAAVQSGAGTAAGSILDADVDPIEVVTDQRAAMVRAIELRDDPSLPAEERERWAVAVERLAVARHEAKRALAERRRDDPTEASWVDAHSVAELAAQDAARADDRDPDGLDARGAPPAPGEDSGRGEPAAGQAAADRVGPETGAGTTASDPRLTDQLTSGPGLAGGTGGAGSQNYPADTGVRPETPPLAPDEDVEPPDVAHR